MCKGKILTPGINFLEECNGLKTRNHVMVDRSDWEKVIKFFKRYPNQFNKLVCSSDSLGNVIDGNNELEISL